jgi:hypothetical protein
MKKYLSQCFAHVLLTTTAFLGIKAGLKATTTKKVYIAGLANGPLDY